MSSASETSSPGLVSESIPYNSLSAGSKLYIIGAGPVGLLLTALLQLHEGFSIRLYEKRPEYVRTRMVRLAPYLVADSIESYSADTIDGETVQAVFEPEELEQGLAFRQSIPTDLMSFLRDWESGFVPLNSIERILSLLITERPTGTVERKPMLITAEEVMALVEPGDVVIDCTGSKSLLRNHLAVDTHAGDVEANTLNIQLEYAIVVTFLYGQAYDCNEFCKYYKNIENTQYKFIPAVAGTSYDGTVSHVTGIINITADDYAAMPPKFDGAWLREHFPQVAASMDHFIDKIKLETHGEMIGDLEIVRIPLNLYKARNVTSRKLSQVAASDHPFIHSPVFLVGDSAMGSPYFQSISLGFECAMYLAGLLTRRDLTLGEIFDRYELYLYKQWLRVYMRSKMIKHNKDLFEAIDDKMALLSQLHIY